MTIRSKASSLIERLNRSQWAFKFGLRGGKRSGFTPLSFSNASNACVNFGSCPCRLRINLLGSPVDCHRGKKAWTREISWAPSGPLTPGDTREASRVDAPHHQLRPLPVAASHPGLLTDLYPAAMAARGSGAPR